MTCASRFVASFVPSFVSRSTRPRFFAAAFLLLAGYCSAPLHAAVTSIDAIQVAKPANLLPGYTTTDIVLDFTGNLRGQQMIVELTQGSIYQDPFGSNTPPSGAFYDLAPFVEFDTFVAIGGRRHDGNPPLASYPVLVVGGAVDLQPGSALKFDTEGLNIAWAPGTGIDVPSGTDYFTARITLSNDARGRFRYFGSTGAGTGDPLVRDLDISGGSVCFFEGCGGPLVVEDKTVEYTAMFPATIVSETLPYSGAGPFGESWSLESFDAPNGKPAAVDPDTGLFTWDGYGSPEGIYEAVIRFTLDGGESDTGTLSIVWHVPEPATGLLLMAIALPAIVCRRRT